jgi:3-phenylpropionate/cinnamic acid dioxygenase small subunit
LIDAAFYDSLVRDFSAWGEEAPADAAVTALLLRESRCLDEGRYDDWLALYAERCVYWVPATPGGGDPRREVAVAFDDRRRLEDRIFRLRTGSAWSQVPASRTVRLVTNIARVGERKVRANFIVSEFRAGETRFWSGWYGYRLAADGKVEVKQVNLLDCDQHLRNPSILL